VVYTGFRATDPNTVDLSSGKVQLVEFYAEWSRLSQSMAPVMQGLEERYRDRIGFVYLNVDDRRTRPLQAELGYNLITRPHFYLIDGEGNVLAEWVGYVSEAEFEAAFNQAVPAPDANGT
jgi:thiol-disulfide isomerase/thioredoxin